MPQQEQTVVAEEARYWIDLQWFEQANRSFQVILSSRLCPKHQAESGSLLGKLTAPKKDLRVFRVFKECCSREQKDFFHPNLPVKEALLRILLSNGNQPMTAEELSERLIELGLDDNGLRDVSPVVIARLIDHDDWYGLNEYEAPS
jgi:hypothetical protein